MDLLAAMRVYVRVVERGSMSAAARDLGLGQPAVSERIERLEEHLAARLLHRNTRRISVTDVGVAFYERSKAALEVAGEALSVVSENRPLRGTLRIAAPHGVGEVVLPPVLLRLRENHPALRIDLVLNDRIVDPVTEGVDISLRLGEIGGGTFVARRLGRIRRLLVAAPAYLDRHGTPRTPGDLVDHPFLRVAGLFNDGRLPLEGIEPVPVDIVFSAGHWRALQAMLEGGAGIGVLQEPVCAEQIADGRLVRLLPDFAVPGFELHALYPAGRPASPPVRAVLSLLAERITVA
jgi:DNA-binding transcriptional LysR family regulator